MYYTVQETNLLHEATKSGQTVTDYFYNPQPGKPLSVAAGTKLNVENQQDPLQVKYLVTLVYKS